MPTISLIICTYQRPEAIKRLLKSIIDQTVFPTEIIVVDGSLDDKTKFSVNEVSKQVSERLIYVRVDHNNRGLTRQRNVGIKKASGEIIAFLDDDTVPDPGYFEHILACFERHPEAIGVGGQITTGLDWKPANLEKNPSFGVYRWEGWEKPESYRGKIRKLLGLASNLPPGWMPAFGHGRSSGYPSNGKDYPVEFVIGAAFAWRRDLFSSCQFSNYFIGYGLYEDLDFCVRASRIGQIYLCTSAQLEHYHASGGRPNQFAYGKMVVRNGWFVWRRRWPNPKLIDRIKWWEISLLLAFLRLIDWRSQGTKEALGRFAGCFSILFSPPRESM